MLYNREKITSSMETKTHIYNLKTLQIHRINHESKTLEFPKFSLTRLETNWFSFKLMFQ